VIEPEPPITEAVRHPLPSELIHDLRNQLNQIIGYSGLLIEQALGQGQDDFVADLQKIHAAGQQMFVLIDENLLAVSSSETRAGSAAPSQEDAADEAAPELPMGNGGTGFVLVVDDIESNRDVLSRRLERQGYSVATAENGRQALVRLRAETFDLVLLDIMMPMMDGYEVLQQLKADEALRHIPVIMISALSELDSVVRCIGMGAEDYLPKPFEPTLLRARLGACLEK